MRYVIFITLAWAFCACGTREPDNPPNTRFFGKTFQMSLIAARRYQRPEQHGFRALKSTNGDTYAVEKAVLIGNAQLTKANGLTYSGDDAFFGIKMHLNPEGIKIFNQMLQQHRNRRVAFIVDDFVVSTFDAKSAVDKKIIDNGKLNVRAKFTRNEIETVLKGFLSVRK